MFCANDTFRVETSIRRETRFVPYQRKSRVVVSSGADCSAQAQRDTGIARPLLTWVEFQVTGRWGDCECVRACACVCESEDTPFSSLGAGCISLHWLLMGRSEHTHTHTHTHTHCTRTHLSKSQENSCARTRHPTFAQNTRANNFLHLAPQAQQKHS